MANYIVLALNKEQLLHDPSLGSRMTCHMRLLRVKLRLGVFHSYLRLKSLLSFKPQPLIKITGE